MLYDNLFVMNIDLIRTLELGISPWGIFQMSGWDTIMAQSVE